MPDSMPDSITDSIADAVKVDGRRLRSDRSRQVIIQSMLQLIKEGNLVPTAQQVADHANVGIRSVFRHFEDMESIFATGDELLRDDFANINNQIDHNGTLQERIRGAADYHANLYETASNVMRSTNTRRWNSEVLQTNYAKYQRKIRSDLDLRLPELSKLSPSKREAADGIASFEFWDRLRDNQSMSVTASTDIVVEMLNAILG